MQTGHHPGKELLTVEQLTPLGRLVTACAKSNLQVYTGQTRTS